MVVVADNHGDPVRDGGRLNKLAPCGCRSDVERTRRQKALLAVDGLKPMERKLRFAGLADNGNLAVINAVRMVSELRQGLVTLTGKPGTGKTTLLVCAVNEARDNGAVAVYTTVTDLLDYLRRAYDPHNTGLTADGRWNLLINADVLALDELDEWNATPWAEERFLRLMDERWRAMDRCLTLCATNSALDALPGKVASRLRDGRAEVHEIGGADMRPLLGW